jgi:hypothetical protein
MRGEGERTTAPSRRGELIVNERSGFAFRSRRDARGSQGDAWSPWLPAARQRRPTHFGRAELPLCPNFSGQRATVHTVTRRRTPGARLCEQEHFPQSLTREFLPRARRRGSAALPILVGQSCRSAPISSGQHATVHTVTRRPAPGARLCEQEHFPQGLTREFLPCAQAARQRRPAWTI